MLLWVAVGYLIAFTPGNVAVGHLAPHVPESVYALFQLSFAASPQR